MKTTTRVQGPWLEAGTKEPVGGAARFAGMLNAQTDDPLVLFSGDALNPSMASTFFKVSWSSVPTLCQHPSPHRPSPALPNLPSPQSRRTAPPVSSFALFASSSSL